MTVHIIESLPIASLLTSPENHKKILQIVDDLVSWTIDKHKPEKESDDDPRKQRYQKHRRDVLHLWEWNKFLFSWLSRLSNLLSSEETNKHILVPIKTSWPDTPRLTADLLEYYFFTNIAMASTPTAKAQAEWREMCGWILDDLHGKRNDQYLDEDEAAAASLIIFVHHNMALFDKGWEHVTLFTDVIDKWIDTIEANANFYSHLLIMLSEAGKSFFPEPTLKWLNRFLAASWHTKELLEQHQNGVRTAELLERVWNDAEGHIRSDKPTLQRYSWLVDQLIPLGIPLANLLQQKLEQRS